MAPAVRDGRLLEKRKVQDFLRMVLLSDMLKQAHYNTASLIFSFFSAPRKTAALWENKPLWKCHAQFSLSSWSQRGNLRFYGSRWAEWWAADQCILFLHVSPQLSWTYRSSANKQHIEVQEDLDLLSQNMDAQSNFTLLPQAGPNESVSLYKKISESWVWASRKILTQ